MVNLRALNIYNIKKFLSALRQEPLHKVIRNSLSFILGKNHKKSEGIYYYIDHSGRIGEYYIVYGWIVSMEKIIEAKLSINDTILVPLTKRYLREDIKALYPTLNHHENGGVIFLTKELTSIDSANLEIRLHNGKEIQIPTKLSNRILDLSSIPFEVQYQIYLSLNNSHFTNLDFAYNPKISIITPVYNVSSKWLDNCIHSVLRQSYSNWELCLFDDGSSSDDTLRCLKKWESKDVRIKIHYSAINEHISIASNKAIELATGDFIGFLDHDDELNQNALLEVVKILNTDQQVDLIYSDEDKIDQNGLRHSPYFKPNFSLFHVRSNNYICHFLVVRKKIGDSVGWFRTGFEGAQDHDLILSIVDNIDHDRIAHIPKILYHWRTIKGSTASGFNEKDYAFKAGLEAIKSHLERNNLAGQVIKGNWLGAYRIKYEFDQN